VTTPRANPFTDDDIRKLDASYKSFPSFAEWAKTSLDLKRWEQYTSPITKLKQVPPEIWREAQAIVERATAFDTGVIEGLYDLPKGFTITVAQKSDSWENLVREKKDVKTLSHIKAQLAAYEYISGIAKQEEPITEKVIRELHIVMCESQDTYEVNTNIGLKQDHQLHKGKYKKYPNHVRSRDGKIHYYAPAEDTQTEMKRFVDILRSEEFQQAHPILQSSYAHYAFILIHPFADGNGRVARALASTYTYKNQHVPLLLFSEKREEYLNALADADAGGYKSFVDFISAMAFDAIQLFTVSIEAASVEPVGVTLAKLSSLSKTKGGYTHSDVDRAGKNLILAFENILRQELQKEHNEHPELFQFSVDLMDGGLRKGATKGYRHFDGYRILKVETASKQIPSNVSLYCQYDVIIPEDSAADDDILLRRVDDKAGKESPFSIRASELVSGTSSALKMNLSAFAQKIIREILLELEKLASKSLGRT
jgi:Fic family protein